MALQSRSPQRPDDLVAEFEEAGSEQVAAAAGQARTAAGRWAAASAVERASASMRRPRPWPERPAS